MLRRRRSPHHARLHRAASHARLLGRQEADCSRLGGAGNHQGAAQSEIHAGRARRGRLHRGQPAASRTPRNRAPGAPRFYLGRCPRARSLHRRGLRRRPRTRAPRRSRVRLTSSAPDPGGTRGRRHHVIGRIPAGSDLLPVHQGRDRGVAHRETGRLHSPRRRLHRRRGCGGVCAHVGRGSVCCRVSGTHPGCAVTVDQWQLEKLAWSLPGSISTGTSPVFLPSITRRCGASRIPPWSPPSRPWPPRSLRAPA